MRPSVMNRLTALAYDVLWFIGYLFLLAFVMVLPYLLFWEFIVGLTRVQSHVVASATLLLPAFCWFTIREARIPFASYGKRQTELTIEYQTNPWVGSVIRNVMKFMPLQLVFASVVEGFHGRLGSTTTVVVFLLGVFLALTYVLQVVATPSRRHLPDLISGARVVRLPS